MSKHLDSVLTTSAYSGSGTAIATGALTANEWAAVIGTILGICTFVVNWYYKRKHYQLAKIRLEADLPEEDHYQ